MPFLARMGLYRRFLLRSRSRKAAGSFVACFPPVGDKLFRVMGTELWESGAARESGVRSSPGLKRCCADTYVSQAWTCCWGHLLQELRGDFLKFFWKFSRVSSLGFACCLVRRSIFKTSDFLVLQMGLSPAPWDSLLRCDQVLELFEEGGNIWQSKQVAKGHQDGPSPNDGRRWLCRCRGQDSTTSPAFNHPPCLQEPRWCL